MPNYTWSTLKAPKEVISKITNAGEKFSFNVLIPMPKELENTVSGGTTDDLLFLYILEHCTFKEFKQIYKNTLFQVSFKTKKEYIEHFKKRLNGETYNESTDPSTNEVYARFTGEYYYNLLKKYGVYTWYDWHIKNWGTKWDCWDVDIQEDKINYTTAWNDATVILSKICSMFPNSDIKIESEYEDNYLARWQNCNGILCLVDEYTRDYSDMDWENDDICEYEESHPWISLKNGCPIDTNWM